MSRDEETEGLDRTGARGSRAWKFSATRGVTIAVAMAAALAMLDACRMPGKSLASRYKNVEPFNFEIAIGPKQFHIDGYLSHSTNAGKSAGLLVLNDGGRSVENCVQMSQHLTEMGIQVACV